jgi:hypothetical protein
VLKVVKLYKLILIQHNIGVVKTVCNSTYRKLKLYLSHVRPNVSILINMYMMS